jgi:hypothetical protein
MLPPQVAVMADISAESLSGERIPSVVQEHNTPEASRPLDPNSLASIPDETTIRHPVIRWRELYDDILRYANGGRHVQPPCYFETTILVVNTPGKKICVHVT